jgi:hypothetical protein
LSNLPKSLLLRQQTRMSDGNRAPLASAFPFVWKLGNVTGCFKIIGHFSQFWTNKFPLINSVWDSLKILFRRSDSFHYAEWINNKEMSNK